MGWQHTVYVYPTLVAMAIALALGTYTLLHVREHGSDRVRLVFLTVTAGFAIWTGFAALKLLQTDPELKFVFYRLLHVGIAPLGPLSLVFALVYTDRTHWLKPSVLAAVFAPIVVYLAVLLTDVGGLAVESRRIVETGGLVVLRATDGPAHVLVMQVYTPAIVVFSAAIIGYEAVRLGRAYLPQAVLLTVAILTPIAFSVLSLLAIPPFDPDGVNFVPTSAAVSVTAFGIAVFRYRWFDLPPIAYSTLLEDAPDAVLVADTEGRIVHANDPGQRLLASLAVDVDDHLTAAFPTFDACETRQELLELDTTEGDRTLDVRSRRIERHGRTLGSVFVVEDVTERHTQQQSLQDERRKLDEFASVVSHDLRSPLAVASGRLELLREESDSEHIDDIERAHRRMSVLIEDVLTLAREGATVSDLEPVSLSPLVEECWGTTDTSTASLRSTVDPSVTVLADESRLRQLLENLMRNAVEHGGDGVTVSVGAVDGGFYIEDDGPGIPESDREKVLESSYTTTIKGTGLGLPIAAQIAEAHGWTLGVTAAEGGGARFEITGVDA